MAVEVPRIKLNNGVLIPAIGLGTWRAKKGEVKDAVKKAIDAGYRHFDCAMFYENESEVGLGIKEKIGIGVVKREDLFITSKLWCNAMRPDLVEPMLRKSLENFGLKYLDQYLIHWPTPFQEGKEFVPKDRNGKTKFSDIDYVDTWKAMEEIYKKGLAKSIGVSNFNVKQLKRLLEHASIKPMVNQIILRFLVQLDVIPLPKSTNEQRIQENINIFDFELNSIDMEAIRKLNSNTRYHPHHDCIGHKNYPFDEGN